MTNPYEPREPSDVAKLVAAYPLCWVVAGDPDSHLAAALPLLAETGPDGRVESLLGHMSRANPLRSVLENEPRATILCMGPQGYISPRLVSNPTWGPTWNYAACRFEVLIRFVPDETDSALWRLAQALEGNNTDAWTPDRMGDRYDQLKERIIAFRAQVRESSPRFKLGQDESDVVFNDIVELLTDRTLADWMKQTRA